MPASPAVAAAPTPAAPASVPATSPAVGARAAAPSARPPQVPKGSALRRARTHQRVQAHVLRPVLGQLRAEGLRGCKPRGPAPLRSAAACAPSAVLVRDGGRPLPVAGQRRPRGLPPGRPQQSGFRRTLHRRVLVRGLCGSAEAFLENCLQRRVLQGPRVVVLAGLHKIVQVEVVCDERGGLAVRLVQQRLVPLKVAHHLLKARALVEAVRPERASSFTVAQLRPPPVPRPGARPVRHVVQVPLPLLRLPALAQPVVEGPRLLQFAVALQQQRLQVIAGERPAEPPEHPRLVAGLYGHHAFTLVRLRLWSAGHKRTASPACAGRAAALL